MFVETKGTGFRMTEVGGEVSADGEKDKSKTKANDRAGDAKLENFSEGKNYYDRCTLLAKIIGIYMIITSKYTMIIFGQSPQAKHPLAKHTQ